MDKKILIIIFSLIGVVAIAGVGFYGFQKTSSKIDPAIKTVADKYIISLVGEAEFNKNYQFDYEKTEKCSNNRRAAGLGCYIRYKFLPAEKYGESEYLFYYTFTDNKVAIANNGIPLTLPSCEKDKNKCDFKITVEELKAIARRENLSDKYFKLVSYNGQIVAEASYCDLNTTENRRKIYVDLLNGAILWSGPNSECQGIS